MASRISIVMLVAALCFLPSTFGFATSSAIADTVFSPAKGTCFFSYTKTETKLLQSSQSLPQEQQRFVQLWRVAEALSTRRCTLEQSLRKTLAAANAMLVVTHYRQNRKAIMSSMEHSFSLPSFKNLASGATGSVGEAMREAKQFLQAPNKALFQRALLANLDARYSGASSGPSTDLSSYSADSTTYMQARMPSKHDVVEEARLQAKYAAIESLEERAFQICLDLGMI
jgi:hypothetical protein